MRAKSATNGDTESSDGQRMKKIEEWQWAEYGQEYQEERGVQSPM